MPLQIIFKWLCCVSCFGKKLGIYDDFHDTLSLSVHSKGETKFDQSKMKISSRMKKEVLTENEASSITMHNDSSMQASSSSSRGSTTFSKVGRFAWKGGHEIGSEEQINGDRNVSEGSHADQSRIKFSAYMQEKVVAQNDIAVHNGTPLDVFGQARATHFSKIGSLTQLWQNGRELGSGAQMPMLPIPIFICLLLLVCCSCSALLQGYSSRKSRNFRIQKDRVPAAVLSREAVETDDVFSNDSSTDEALSGQASAPSLLKEAKLAVLKREKLEKQLRREKLEKQLHGAPIASRPNSRMLSGNDAVGAVAAPMPKKVRRESPLKNTGLLA